MIEATVKIRHAVKRARLANGLRTIAITRPHLSRVHVAVYVGVGGWHERAGRHGASHLLEHMLFRGNALLPTQQLNDEAFDAIGAYVNAYTGATETALVASVPPRHAGQAAWIMAAMLTTPTFASFEIERQIATQEAAALFAADGAPASADHRAVMLALGPRLGLPATGSPQDIAQLTARRLRAHHARHYVAGNMVAVCVGPLRATQMDHVLDAFKRVPRGPATIMPRVGKPRHRFEARKDRDPSPSLKLIFQAPGIGHRDAMTTHVLSTLLDSGPMGRLWKRLRGDVGLVYESEAIYHEAGLDGALSIYTSAEADRLARVTREIFAMLEELWRDTVSERELLAAKLRGARSVEQLDDDLPALSSSYGIPELLGRPLDIERQLRLLAKVSAADVRRCANSVLSKNRLSMLVAGVERRATRNAIKRIVDEWGGR